MAYVLPEKIPISVRPVDGENWVTTLTKQTTTFTDPPEVIDGNFLIFRSRGYLVEVHRRHLVEVADSENPR